MSTPERDPQSPRSEHPADEDRDQEPNRDQEPTRDDLAARHPDLQADLRERADGANAEQITDEANLRANPDPPE